MTIALTPPRPFGRGPSPLPPVKPFSDMVRAVRYAIDRQDAIVSDSRDAAALRTVATAVAYAANDLTPAAVASLTLLVCPDEVGYRWRVPRADLERSELGPSGRLREHVERGLRGAHDTAFEHRLSLVGPVRVEYGTETADLGRPMRPWDPATALPPDAVAINVLMRIPARPLLLGNLPPAPDAP